MMTKEQLAAVGRLHGKRSDAFVEAQERYIAEIEHHLDALRRVSTIHIYDKPETLAVLQEVAAERRCQHAKWGQQDLPDVHPWASSASLVDSVRVEQAAKLHEIPEAERAKRMVDHWATKTPHLSYAAIAVEELAEAVEEGARGRTDRLRAELVQLAAVAVQWIEAIDRRKEPGRG